MQPEWPGSLGIRIFNHPQWLPNLKPKATDSTGCPLMFLQEWALPSLTPSRPDDLRLNSGSATTFLGDLNELQISLNFSLFTWKVIQSP